MAFERALQPVALALGAGVDRADERAFFGIERDQGVGGPVRPARILREGDLPVRLVEAHRQIVLPVLADLLQIFAGTGRRDAGGGDEAHETAFPVTSPPSVSANQSAI